MLFDAGTPLPSDSFTAFVGDHRVTAGDLPTVASGVVSLAHADDPVLIFDDATGQQVELDLRRGPEHGVAEYRARQSPPSRARKQRGRPRLGVVAREVTLLPRQWEWLGAQPGGASATLRRLVEDARRASSGPARARQAQEALYRVIFVLAGDRPGFEEAARALFGRDDARFDALIANWPEDVAAYARKLAAAEREARAAA